MVIIIIYLNGKIYSMTGQVYQAMAVEGGKILALGSNSSIEGLISPSIKRINLHNKAVLPGFNDSHLHILEYGLTLKYVDLSNCRSIDEIIKTASEFIKTRKLSEGEWLIGCGWDQTQLKEKSYPTKEILDKISAKHPIYFTRVCSHVAAANSLALDISEVSPDTIVSGGNFEKDSHGCLTGIMKENAMDWFEARMPRPSKQKIISSIKDAMDIAVKAGITSIQTSDLHSCSGFDEIHDIYTSLADSSQLKVRVNEQVYLPTLDKLNTFLEKGLRSGYGSNMFRVGPVKLLTDGSLGARTAALSQDYTDMPGNRGMLLYTQKELDEIVYKAHSAGMQLFLHAIGDAAIDTSLRAIERALTLHPSAHRHRINHFQIGRQDLFGKAAALGITADIQPGFVAEDWKMASERLGSERITSSYAWASLKSHGIPLAGGSDCPFSSIAPLSGISAAVTRQDSCGNPKGGWTPSQCLSIYDAISLFTKGSAYASCEENLKGTLDAGKLADFIVLSEDPFEINTEEIKNLDVLMTVMGGNMQYCSDEFLI